MKQRIEIKGYIHERSGEEDKLFSADDPLWEYVPERIKQESTDLVSAEDVANRLEEIITTEDNLVKVDSRNHHTEIEELIQELRRGENR